MNSENIADKEGASTSAQVKHVSVNDESNEKDGNESATADDKPMDSKAAGASASAQFYFRRNS